MIVTAKTFSAMPADLQALFSKLPNPGSDEVRALFPETKNGGNHNREYSSPSFMFGDWKRGAEHGATRFGGDSGSAARFFYQAKASRRDRNEGCDDFFWRRDNDKDPWRRIDRETWERLDAENEAARKAERKPPHKIARGNIHNTVKPAALMAYLCRLVTPPGGVIIDGYMGSGSTGKEAIREGFRFVGIERDANSFDIAVARIKHALSLTNAHVVSNKRPNVSQVSNNAPSATPLLDEIERREAEGTQ